MAAYELKIDKSKKLPQFDLPVDFIVYDGIDASLLNFYTQFPCKIEACIFAYIQKGAIRARINLWQHDITQNDIVIVIPGTFIQVEKASPDTKICFAGFSSTYLKSINFWKTISPLMLPLFKEPILKLSPEIGSLYGDAISLLTRASSMQDVTLTPHFIGSIMNLFIDSLAETYNKTVGVQSKPRTSHDHAILSEFLQLAFENYRDEHKISFYAHEANLTLSHFCNVISKATSMTPQEIIMHMIIMDAKTQLKGTDLSVNKIAVSLGFPTPTTFNRYFRTYTNMTPQEYRNSNDNDKTCFSNEQQ